MALHRNWVHGTAFAPPELPSVGVDEVNDNRWTDLTGLRPRLSRKPGCG